MPLNEQEIEALQRLIVQPLSDKMDLIIKPIVSDVDSLKVRMSSAEGSLAKFTKVYAAVVAALTFIGPYLWTKVKRFI